jgi:hypothetical protein
VGIREQTPYKTLVYKRSDHVFKFMKYSTLHSEHSLEINKDVIAIGITKSGDLGLYLVFVGVSSTNCLCNTTMMENKKN